jgi:uncharacterized protein
VSAPLRPTPRRGRYDDPFWEFVSDHDLRLQQCDECGSFRYPPGPACSRCLSLQWSWEPIAGAGSLLSWVVFHRQYFPEFPVPHVVVAAELPEGPILIADLADGADHELSAGTSLRIAYEPASTAEGAEWTIFRWELAAS